MLDMYVYTEKNYQNTDARQRIADWVFMMGGYAVRIVARSLVNLNRIRMYDM